MVLRSIERAFCHDALFSSVVFPFISWFGVHFRIKDDELEAVATPSHGTKVMI